MFVALFLVLALTACTGTPGGSALSTSATATSATGTPSSRPSDPPLIDPSGAALTTAPPRGSTNLPGVGAVCDLSKIEGRFARASRPGTAYVYHRPGPAACTDTVSPAPAYFIAFAPHSGEVIATYGPIDCHGCVRAAVFAAPDIDSDGRADIAVAATGADPIRQVSLYRVTNSSAKRAAIEPWTVAPPGGVPYTQPSPLSFAWGGVGSVLFGAYCTDKDGVLSLNLWKADLAGWHPTRLHTVRLSIDASLATMTPTRTLDAPISSFNELPRGRSRFCGEVPVA